MGGESFFTFVVLPFGLSSAHYVFTKIIRPLVRLWRSKGLKAIVYLDDGIVAVHGNQPRFGPCCALGGVRSGLHLLCPRGEEWAPLLSGLWNAAIVKRAYQAWQNGFCFVWRKISQHCSAGTVGIFLLEYGIVTAC